MLGRDDVEGLSSSNTLTMAVQMQRLPPSGRISKPRLQNSFLNVLYSNFWYFGFRVCDLRPVLNCRSCHKTHSLVPTRLYK